MNKLSTFFSKCGDQMKATSFHSLSLPCLHTNWANKIKQTKSDQKKRPFPKEKTSKKKKETKQLHSWHCIWVDKRVIIVIIIIIIIEQIGTSILAKVDGANISLYIL